MLSRTFGCIRVVWNRTLAARCARWRAEGHFAVLSTGEKVPHPRDWERHERQLKRWQRRLARCQRGSANRREEHSCRLAGGRHRERCRCLRRRC